MAGAAWGREQICWLRRFLSWSEEVLLTFSLGVISEITDLCQALHLYLLLIYLLGSCIPCSRRSSITWLPRLPCMLVKSLLLRISVNSTAAPLWPVLASSRLRSFSLRLAAQTLRWSSWWCSLPLLNGIKLHRLACFRLRSNIRRLAGCWKTVRLAASLLCCSWGDETGSGKCGRSRAAALRWLVSDLAEVSNRLISALCKVRNADPLVLLVRTRRYNWFPCVLGRLRLRHPWRVEVKFRATTISNAHSHLRHWARLLLSSFLVTREGLLNQIVHLRWTKRLGVRFLNASNNLLVLKLPLRLALS